MWISVFCYLELKVSERVPDLGRFWGIHDELWDEGFVFIFSDKFHWIVNNINEVMTHILN